MIKNIGILTYHAAHNYGSMLQAYALQTYLKKCGFNPEMINLRITAQKKAYNNPLGRIGIRTLKRLLFSMSTVYNDWQKWRRFERFLQTKYNLSKKEFHSWKEVLEYLNHGSFDAVICGSDQIWNMTCVDYNESYFLPSNLKGIIKIAYAPSFGGFIERFQDAACISFIKKNTSLFDSLSVREKSGADFLSSLLGKNVPIVPDPTFLLQKSDYEPLVAKEPIIKGDYVLYYTPWHVKQAEDIALQIGKVYGCHVITTNGNEQTNKFIIQKNDIGPAEFLNVVKNARVVCGLSFHLVVFSLLFEKEFYSINGDRDNRLVTLLNLLGLTERAISINDTFCRGYENINYSDIKQKITMLRQVGVDYINNNLSEI